jgi:hypothetical protein
MAAQPFRKGRTPRRIATRIELLLSSIVGYFTILPVGGKQMDENDKDLVPQEKHIERINEVRMPS